MIVDMSRDYPGGDEYEDEKCVQNASRGQVDYTLLFTNVHNFHT